MPPKRFQNAPKIPQIGVSTLNQTHFLTDLVRKGSKMASGAQKVTIFDIVCMIYRILRPFCRRIARSYRILRGFVNVKMSGF